MIDSTPPCETSGPGEDSTLNYSYNESLKIDEEKISEALGFGEDGYPIDGSFEPSLETVLEKLQINPGDEPLSLRNFYTVEEGECEDTVVLNIGIFS